MSPHWFPLLHFSFLFVHGVEFFGKAALFELQLVSEEDIPDLRHGAIEG
jgi:hypothetical protein